MSIVDKNALELCLQIGGERFGKRVFPDLQFDLPPINYDYTPRKPDFLFNIITDAISDSLQACDPDSRKKHGSLLSGGVD